MSLPVDIARSLRIISGTPVTLDEPLSPSLASPLSLSLSRSNIWPLFIPSRLKSSISLWKCAPPFLDSELLCLPSLYATDFGVAISPRCTYSFFSLSHPPPLTICPVLAGLLAASFLPGASVCVCAVKVCARALSRRLPIPNLSAAAAPAASHCPVGPALFEQARPAGGWSGTVAGAWTRLGSRNNSGESVLALRVCPSCTPWS